MLIVTGSILEEFAIGVIEGIKNNIRNKQVTPYGAQHSTGQAEDSLFYRITENSLIIGSTWAYITILEDGRRPGKFAPPEVIEKWIEDKPVLADISKKSLAFLINRKMKEEGSLLYKQGGHSGVLSEFTSHEYVHDNLTDKYRQAIADQITGILFKSA